MQRTKFVWQLFHLRQDYKEAVLSKATFAEAITTLHEKHEQELAAAEGADAQLAALKKQRTSVTRDLDKLRRKREQKVPLGLAHACPHAVCPSMNRTAVNKVCRAATAVMCLPAECRILRACQPSRPLLVRTARWAT